MSKKVIVVATLLAITAATSVLGQAKVGTTAAQFLGFSPSVRINGMGLNGVAIPDFRSGYYNPAAIVSGSAHRFQGSFYPGGTTVGPDITYRAHSAAIPFAYSQGVPRGALAIQHGRLNADGMVERTYDQGTVSGIGRTFGYDGDMVSMVGAYRFGTGVQLSLGGGGKYIREELQDITAETWAVTLGLLGRIPLHRSISEAAGGSPFSADLLIGASVADIGPDIQFIEREYPIETVWRIGVASQMTWGQLDDPEVTLLPTVTLLRQDLSDEDLLQVGIEASYRQAFFVRAGAGDGVFGADHLELYKTFGGGISTMGLKRLFAPQWLERPDDNLNFGQFLLKYLNVSFDYAHVEDYWLSGEDYYELTVSL